ncbi:MAG: hypothetical protein KatS3mg103_1455 [Phycisphaerales bacterium]|nr:MAG: hypothetical protein KatS3mg103_1455 [Phycisphaerales bacterium]
MPDRTIAVLLALAVMLGLSACGNEHHAPDPATDDHQHHAGDGHDHDHDHQAGDDHDHDHDHDHGPARPLGTVAVLGTTLEVVAQGQAQPGAVVHLDIRRADGPEPAAVRVWIGDRSATGAIKRRAVGGSGAYHADVTTPDPLPEGSALWIEVQDAQGDRHAEPIALD